MKLIEYCKNIRDSKWFDNTIFFVIIFASLIIGLETYSEIKNSFELQFRIIEEIILAIFVIEIIIRTIAEINKPIRLLTNGWYIFDFIIVAVCFIPYFSDDFNTAYFVVLRMARILRMVRLFERVHNLNILIQSLLRSLPSMTYVVILLFIQFYIFSVVGTDLLGKYEPDSFGTLFLTMRSLFFVAFEGWSWVYDLPGIEKALNNGLSDYILVIYFVSFIMIAAVVFLNLFVGILTNEISETKLDEKNSNKRIQQTNHTLILGWSEQIYAIVSNLVIANESENKSYIVILADKNTKLMSDELSLHIEDYKYTKIIFREGLPTNIEYLRLVRPEDAKSIIILSQDVYGQHDDIKTIMQILVLMQLNNDNSKYNIIADLDNEDNFKLAKKLIEDYGCIISTEEIIGKILAEISINKYLAEIYEEIVGFDGSEIYILPAEDLIEKTFEEAMFLYNQSVLLGVYKYDNSFIINPNKDYIFKNDDSIIILSEDDSTAVISKKNNHKRLNPQNSNNIEIVNENTTNNLKILILGWNIKSKIIIEELYSYLDDKSKIQVISQNPEMEKEINELKNKYIDSKIELSFISAPIITYRDLSNYNIKEYDSIVVLSNNDGKSDFLECDANTMMTLVNLRAIQKEENCNFHISAELLTKGNQNLVKIQNIADFVLGPDLISSFISMVSENKDIYDVYIELFSSYGSSIIVKDLKSNNEIVTFSYLTELALQNNEIAIGYINDDGKIKINPPKTEQITIKQDTKLILITNNN